MKSAYFPINFRHTSSFEEFENFQYTSYPRCCMAQIQLSLPLKLIRNIANQQAERLRTERACAKDHECSPASAVFSGQPLCSPGPSRVNISEQTA